MSAVPIEYYTYENYREWEGDWELIDGIPYAMSPAPMKKHQYLSYTIAFELRRNLNCKECEVLGEVDYKVNSDTVLRPDVILTCNDHGIQHLIKAPEIVFEVISPSSAKRDETLKFQIYEEEGVQFYILVYPDDLKAKIYELKNGKYQKVGDFSKEIFDFGICEVKVDFEKVFERYRKRVDV